MSVLSDLAATGSTSGKGRVLRATADGPPSVSARLAIP
jgi:hypothetical protein